MFIKYALNLNGMKLKKKGQLTGSKKDLEDGYIHFSGEDQVEGYAQ